MRIHSNVLTTIDIRNALKEEKKAGRIAQDVYFHVLTLHKSRSREAAFEVQLKAGVKIKGRRLANSGGYGASGDYAATYDEWGWFLAALYLLDPKMLVPYYEDVWEFQTKTGLSYHPVELIDFIEKYGTDPYPYVWRKPQAGRIGYGRTSGDDVPRSHLALYKHMPRSIVQVQEFGKLNPVLVADYGQGRAHVKDAAGNFLYTTSLTTEGQS